jgi:ribosome biogenesis GTPase
LSRVWSFLATGSIPASRTQRDESFCVSRADASTDDTGTIERIHTRKTTLTRVDSRGRRELVAANVTQLIVVIAPEPSADWLLLDRFLVAAELMRIKATIMLNKIDLGCSLPDELGAYAGIGYAYHTSSARDVSGLDDLQAVAKAELSALVGQSGVGKSSIINALLADTVLSTAELSRKGRQGRHTTTTATLHHLPAGGDLIDSPGVRKYSPYIEHENEVARGFREFREFLGQCRFTNCRHLAEPGCAIKRATHDGRVTPRRYESYVKLFGLVADLRARRES